MVSLLLLALAILVPPFQGTYSQQDNACSFGGNRAANLNRCLAAIRFRALDKVNSAYGQAHFDRCTPQERFNINCFEADRLDEPKSLAQLALGVDTPDLSTLDRDLITQYISPAGSYTGCDHTYNYPNEKSFYVNPLTNNAYPSWDLRRQPIFTWDYKDGEVFTLISRDPNGDTKLVIANIQGNDFTTAMTLYAYDGHRNFRNSPRPGTFMLYRQTRPLFVERIPSARFNVTDFAERNQLQGPVAFSWVNALYDAYGVGRYQYGDNCAGLVQDALRPLLPRIDYLPNDVDLKVFVRVRKTTRAVPYDCGIYTITPPARDVYFDPINPGSNPLTVADMRAGAPTRITMIMNKVNPRPSDFNGKLHSIMLVSIYNNTKYLTGMVVNIEGDTVTRQGDQLNTGSLLQPYTEPNLVETGTDHFYSVLVYEQAARIPTTLDITPYLSCTNTREFPNMNGFISDHRLTLVGVSRVMFKDNDEYSRCRGSPVTPPLV